MLVYNFFLSFLYWPFLLWPTHAPQRLRSMAWRTIQAIQSLNSGGARTHPHFTSDFTVKNLDTPSLFPTLPSTLSFRVHATQQTNIRYKNPTKYQEIPECLMIHHVDIGCKELLSKLNSTYHQYTKHCHAFYGPLVIVFHI